jgi:hypothetical protein
MLVFLCVKPVSAGSCTQFSVFKYNLEKWGYWLDREEKKSSIIQHFFRRTHADDSVRVLSNPEGCVVLAEYGTYIVLKTGGVHYEDITLGY